MAVLETEGHCGSGGI